VVVQDELLQSSTQSLTEKKQSLDALVTRIKEMEVMKVCQCMTQVYEHADMGEHNLAMLLCAGAFPQFVIPPHPFAP
jgi:hypothetical protein